MTPTNEPIERFLQHLEQNHPSAWDQWLNMTRDERWSVADILLKQTEKLPINLQQKQTIDTFVRGLCVHDQELMARNRWKMGTLVGRTLDVALARYYAQHLSKDFDTITSSLVSACVPMIDPLVDTANHVGVTEEVKEFSNQFCNHFGVDDPNHPSYELIYQAGYMLFWDCIHSSNADLAILALEHLSTQSWRWIAQQQKAKHTHAEHIARRATECNLSPQQEADMWLALEFDLSEELQRKEVVLQILSHPRWIEALYHAWKALALDRLEKNNYTDILLAHETKMVLNQALQTEQPELSWKQRLATKKVM